MPQAKIDNDQKRGGRAIISPTLKNSLAQISSHTATLRAHVAPSLCLASSALLLVSLQRKQKHEKRPLFPSPPRACNESFWLVPLLFLLPAGAAFTPWLLFFILSLSPPLSPPTQE